MNPFKVQKIINESSRNGERLIIEELSKKCGERLRHMHVIMSDEMFQSEACGGFPRHWVKGVSLYGWISLWTYKPPKQTDFSPVQIEDDLKSLSDFKNLKDVIDSSSAKNE